MTRSKIVNGKKRKAEMRTPGKAQATMEGMEIKRTRTTKVSRNATGQRGWRRASAGKTHDPKNRNTQRGHQETMEDEKECVVEMHEDLLR